MDFEQRDRFGFGSPGGGDAPSSFFRSTVPLIKRVPVFPLKTYGLDYSYSNRESIRTLYTTFFAFPQQQQTKEHYVDLLDFSEFGGVPTPLPGVQPPKRWFADIRYSLFTPFPLSYPSIGREVLASQRSFASRPTIMEKKLQHQGCEPEGQEEPLQEQQEPREQVHPQPRQNSDAPSSSGVSQGDSFPERQAVYSRRLDGYWRNQIDQEDGREQALHGLPQQRMVDAEEPAENLEEAQEQDHPHLRFELSKPLSFGNKKKNPRN